MFQLGIQVEAVQQQVRAMQGYAVLNVEQTRSDHRDPGREISVVYMDVVHPAPLQLQRVAGTQQRVHQRAQAPHRRLVPLRQYTSEKVRQRGTSA
jgi:hypothetical protein